MSEGSVSSARVLGWAAYLGMSWTWCIGMFLPVLLVRDLGTIGWIVFAVPNVIGAAAMGWVLRTREASEELVRGHLPACWTFSLVTVCFHVFFLGWMIRRLLGDAAGIVVFVAFFLIWVAGRRNARDIWIACALFMASAGSFAWLLGSGDVSIEWRASRDISAALYLLPVCLFGFALCPYLDLTFHQARQHTEAKDARIAFSLGFGFCFLLMIVYSLAYAGLLNALIPTPPARGPGKTVATIIGFHLALQTAFTVVVHLRQLSMTENASSRMLQEPVRSMLILLTVGASAALSVYAGRRPSAFSLPTGEVIYRCFMGFYGLIFPAYVWICMVPGASQRRRQAALFGIAVVAALPFYFMGFVLRRMVWLPPAVAILLIVGAVLLAASRRGAAR